MVDMLWPASETGYVLESTPFLRPDARWEAVAAAPAVVEGRFRVRVPGGEQTRFFRLRRASEAVVTRVLQTSPGHGETGVAVTRESLFRLSAPLAPDSVLTGADLFAEFGGRRLLARTELSADRRTATLFYLENLPGRSRIRVILDGTRLIDVAGRALDADGDGQPGGVRVLEFDTTGVTGLAGTAVIGRVFASEKNADGSNRPLENVTITVDGAEETLRATTDSTGTFTLAPAPAGRFFVHVDGRTAVGSQWPGGAYYPFVGKAWEAVAGVITNLAGGSGEIFLPRIQSDALKPTSPNAETRVTFSPAVLAENPSLRGVEVNVPANALFSDNGARGGSVGIAPVPPDRLPEPLPPGLNLPLVITVQTDGASNFDQPVPVRFPNLPDPVTGVILPPGAKTVLWSFNHDTGRWEPQGLMTISADGQFAVSDPGTGILQPGWHGTSPGSGGRGPRGPGPDPSNRDNGDLDGDGQPDCEGPDCECTQEITCVIPKEGSNVASCALECLGNVVDDIFGDGAKPERTAFETGLRCIGGPAKCPGRPEETLDKKRRDCMDECTDPLADRVVYTMPCEGFSSPCSGPSLHGLAAPGTVASLLPDRLVEQREFWKAEEEFLVKLTGTPRILQSESAEVPLLTAFFDAFSDRVQPTGPSGVRLSAGERAELIALPRPASFSAAEWAAMIDRLDSLQGNPIPADLAAADQRLTDLTAELIRRGWTSRGDGLLHGLAQRSRHAAPVLGSPEFPARAHFFHLKNHRSGFVQRGRLNAAGEFEGLILSPGGYYSVVYLDPVTRRAGVAFFQARQAGTVTVIPTAPLQDIMARSADTDADGLPDHAEQILGTSEVKADSDNDGIPDGRELELNTNPLDGVGLPIGVVSVTPAPGLATDVAAGNHVAVLAARQGLAVYDVSNPSAPLQIAVVPGNAGAVALQGTLALAAFDSGLRLVDLADPAAPKVLWERPDIRAAGGLALGAARAFAVQGASAYSLDLATGAGERVATPTLVESLAVRGDLVYALGPSYLYVFSAGEVFTPLGRVEAPGTGGAGGRPRRLFLDGNRLYATQNFGFNVFDLSAPAAPVLLTDKRTAQAGWRQFVAAGNGLALAADGPNSTDDGPHEVSLYRQTSAGLDIEFISTFVTPGSAYAVSVAGGRAFVADGNAGLTVINFLAPDLAGIPPSAGVVVDSDFTPPQVEGGTVARITAAVSDDIATRRVELFIDGQLAALDDSYPFEIFHLVPPASPAVPSLKVRVRAEDMAGNVGVSPEITVNVVADATPPAILSMEPAPGSIIPFGVLTDIAVAFREPVTTPITAETLTVRIAGADGLLNTADDQVLAGEVQWLVSENAVRLRLPGPMAETAYRVTLAAGLGDAAGNRRGQAFSWEFGTGSPPTIVNLFPPSNLVRVGGTLDELVFGYDQPVPRLFRDTYTWRIAFRTVPSAGGTLGPEVVISPLERIWSEDGRTVVLRTTDTFAPGYYVVTGNGPVLPGMRWEFYFRDVPNEVVGVDPVAGAFWKHPPGVGVGDELIVNLPGSVVPIPTFGVRSIIAYTDAQLVRQRVEVPGPLQFFGGLQIVSSTFGPGITDVHGPATFSASFTSPIEIGPHTLNLRGGGFLRSRLEMRDDAGVLVNHPGSTLVLSNQAGLYGSGGVGGRLVNLGTVRSIATAATTEFDDVLLRNDGRLEIASGTTRVENLENEGVVEIAPGAMLMLAARARAGVSSSFTGAGTLEFGEFNASTRRVVSLADAELRGDLRNTGEITLVAGTVTLWKPLVRTSAPVTLRNSGTLRLLAPSRLAVLDMVDGNLSANSDTEIETLTLGSRADVRVSTRVRVTGDARIGGLGIDVLGAGVLEFAGTTVVTNGTQSGGAYVGNATILNTGNWRQSINSSQGSLLARINENDQLGTGVFENAGVFEMTTERPLSIQLPFRNRGRLVLARASVSIDARPSFFPPRSGAYLPQPGAELILNDTTLDHSSAGTLDLAAGVLRGVGSIQAVGASPAPRVINRAVLRPGNPTGTLVIRATGGFEQAATGELIIGIGTGGNGLLRLDRTAATLGGALTIELLEGFSPALGQSFEVLNYSSRTGEFATVNLPDPGPGRKFELTYQTTTLTLRVVAR